MGLVRIVSGRAILRRVWMRNLRRIGAVALLGWFSAAAAFGQAVSASIVGTVTDASGAVVANAKVTVTEVSTAVNHSGVTNESGNYSFVNLPPGRYTATVEMP